MTNHGLPPPVDRLADTGMDTFLESDRLMALQAANHYDQLEHTRYGAEVLLMFMEQMGLEFMPAEEERKEISQTTLNAKGARLMQAVDMAIGEDIGVRSELLEYVGKAGGYASIHILTDRGEPRPRAVVKETGLTPQRPYLVTQRYSTDKSRWNFSLAQKAIAGVTNVDIADWGRLSEDWRATLSKIRTLDQVPFSRHH